MKCLDTSIAFENFKNKEVRSIILTSGTLTPFDSWEQELKIKFSVALDNGHLNGIHNNVKGFLLKQFNFSFEQRNDEQQLIDLGHIVDQLCDVIPGGLLIVVSSYSVMDIIQDSWTKFNIIDKLKIKKELYWEPRLKNENEPNIQNNMIESQNQQDTYWDTKNMNQLKQFKGVFNQYKMDANQRGAILFCVQRGKYSEGIDLSDNLCRAVVLVGMPFLSIKDSYVNYIMEFINKSYQTLTGEVWYRQQAIRSSNQAIGRVIRHTYDYGAVFLCDSADRFKMEELSSWVQPSITIEQKWTDNHSNEIKKYFYMMEQKNKKIIQQDKIQAKKQYQNKMINSNNIQYDQVQANQQQQYELKHSTNIQQDYLAIPEIQKQENKKKNLKVILRSRSNGGSHQYQLKDQRELPEFQNPQKKIKLKYQKK